MLVHNKLWVELWAKVRKKGIVMKILNMEGINTMYQVQWEDGSLENLRIIEDYLNDLVLLDEEHSHEMQFSDLKM